MFFNYHNHQFLSLPEKILVSLYWFLKLIVYKIIINTLIITKISGDIFDDYI